MPIASLENISKQFGNNRILKNINIDFEKGRLSCLLGSSGSGKTTILRLIAGLEKPEKGKIIIDEQIVSENNRILLPPAERNVGFIFQDLALWPHMTVYENIIFGLNAKKVKNKNQKVKELLTFFNLTNLKERYPNQLSGGQQQLVSIARSLALNPKILLMDEPLTALDVKLKRKIREMVKSLIKEFSVSVIYVTHDHLEAFSLADSIIVIDEGEIITQGTPEEIKSSSIPFIREFIEI